MGDAFDNLKNTPLIDAVRAAQLSTVTELLASDVDVNQPGEQGWTALNWAAGRGDLEMVSLLVQAGADVFKVGRDQRTPYMIALAAGHVEVVKFLRDAEDQAPGEKPPRAERRYCKAYHLKDLRQYSGWFESKINWKDKANKSITITSNDDQEFSDDDIVFMHQDYTVTQSMWHNENVIFNDVTPEWETFSTDVLRFKVPDDIDLIVPAEVVSAAAASASIH